MSARPDFKKIDQSAAILDAARARKAALPASDPETHHDIALATIAWLTRDETPPIYSNGCFWLPDRSGLFVARSLEWMQGQVAHRFNDRKSCRKQSDYRQIAAHMSVLTEDPHYFDDAPPGVASAAGFHQLSPCGAVETVPLMLAHRQTFALPKAPENDAEAPLTDALLAAAFEGDSEVDQTDLWWQCFGAALFGLLPRHQVAVLLLGVQRSGKSTLQRILESAFPADAVCAVSPQQWGHEYHVAALAGKRLNVVGELADDAPIPAAPFKNVTGLNLVGARHPTHRPFSFRNAAAHVFASNVLPPTTDRSEAFYRRWRVIRFVNTVPAERVDHKLLDKIIRDEMPAILAAAFRGAERVARAGALRTTAPHEAALNKWRHAANPLQQFLADDEWIELDSESREHSTRDVYEAYRRWSTAAGFRNPFGRNHFLDLLESTGAGRGVAIRRVASKNVVAGLRLLRHE